MDKNIEAIELKKFFEHLLQAIMLCAPAECKAVVTKYRLEQPTNSPRVAAMGKTPADGPGNRRG